MRWVGYATYKCIKLANVIRVKECGVTSTDSRYGPMEDL
jgi:hypothetical protein